MDAVGLAVKGDDPTVGPDSDGRWLEPVVAGRPEPIGAGRPEPERKRAVGVEGLEAPELNLANDNRPRTDSLGGARPNPASVGSPVRQGRHWPSETVLDWLKHRFRQERGSGQARIGRGLAAARMRLDGGGWRGWRGWRMCRRRGREPGTGGARWRRAGRRHGPRGDAIVANEISAVTMKLECKSERKRAIRMKDISACTIDRNDAPVGPDSDIGRVESPIGILGWWLDCKIKRAVGVVDLDEIGKS